MSRFFFVIKKLNFGNTNNQEKQIGIKTRMIIHNGYIQRNMKREYISIYIKNGRIRRLYKKDIKIREVGEPYIDAMGCEIVPGKIGFMEDVRSDTTSQIYKIPEWKGVLSTYKYRKINQMMNEDDLIVGYGFTNPDNNQILRIVDRAYRFVKEFDYGKYNIDEEEKAFIDIVSKTKPVVIEISCDEDARMAYLLYRRYRLPIIIINNMVKNKNDNPSYISKIWGISHRVGSIRNGKEADIVIYDRKENIKYKIISGEIT